MISDHDYITWLHVPAKESGKADVSIMEMEKREKREGSGTVLALMYADCLFHHYSYFQGQQIAVSPFYRRRKK